jgi:eukaryotic-like serine/threonine-protein kinase
VTANQNRPTSPPQLGHYTLLEEVGDGRLGKVYRARDTALGRTVLVRDAYESVGRDFAARAGFVNRARAATVVSHANVATLFEVGDGPDELFLVFEFVPGQTLDEAQGGQPLGVRQAVDLGIQIADALTALHGAGILHLDVRPATIKLSRRGQGKLLDVGIGVRANTVDRPDAASYQSPEQRGGEPLDARSDVFALGLVLHEMLTGRPPVSGADTTKPSTVNADVPLELDAIVGRATARRVVDRYQSAAPLAAELRSFAAILDVRSGDREPPTLVAAASQPPPKWFGRGAALIAVAALATALWFAFVS